MIMREYEENICVLRDKYSLLLPDFCFILSTIRYKYNVCNFERNVNIFLT